MALEHDKQAKFEAVAKAIFAILIRGGVENLSHTRVAKISKVSRAWIYKYIGKNSDQLVAYSLDAIGKEFAKIDSLLDQKNSEDVRRSIFRGTFRMLADSAENPAMMALYYRYVGTANPIGRKIAELEELYMSSVRMRLEKFFDLPPKEAMVIAEVLHGLRMGLAHRYSSLGLHEKAGFDETIRGLRRVLKHFAIEDKTANAKPGR